MVFVSALVLQLAIGVGGLTLGFLLGGIRGRERVLRARDAAQRQVDDLQSRIAMNRFTISELESKLEAATGMHGQAASSMRLANGATRPARPASPVWLDATPDAGPDPGTARP